MATPIRANAEHGDTLPHVNSRFWNVCPYVDSAPTALDVGLARIDATNVNAQRSCTNFKVKWYAQAYPDSWFGMAPCDETQTPGAGCSLYTVILNTRTAVAAQQRRKTATHEFGHAAGLGHRNVDASVLTQGVSPPVSEFYDGHDVTAINNRYP